MRAVRKVEGRARVVQVDPVRPSDDSVRVRVRSAGICGSDLHLLEGEFMGPVTFGHEIAGVTDDGTAVAIEPVVPCGTCDQCRGGDYHRCRRGPPLLGVSIDGGMADEVLAPPRCLRPLPVGVDLADACLVEPLAVAMHAARCRGELHADERVLVVGGGTIGLTCVAVARDMGATVDLLARHDHQREAGERLGARAAAEAADDVGFDVVFEAAGTESALRDAARRARPGGRIVAVSTYWEPVHLPGLQLGFAELEMRMSSLYTRRDTEDAVALLARTPGLAPTIVTHRFPLDAATEAFETARDRRAGAIKVILEP